MAHDHQLTAAIPLLFKHLDVKFIYMYKNSAPDITTELH